MSGNDETEQLTAEKQPVRRYCRFLGCNNVVKSQGCCQRHGAQTKKCKVPGCDKQAQGTHDGMCKSHWKLENVPPEDVKSKETPPLAPEGESVYDKILPLSMTYKPHIRAGEVPQAVSSFRENNRAWDGYSEPPEDANVMPLVKLLRDGRLEKEAGWHRHEERRARGLPPVPKLKVQLETWERQLAVVEILLLSGGCPYANFKDLAHAWGRERNFHQAVISTVFDRRGEIQRKKRSDTGILLTEEQKQNLRDKRPKKESSVGGENGAAHDGADQVGDGVDRVMKI